MKQSTLMYEKNVKLQRTIEAFTWKHIAKDHTLLQNRLLFHYFERDCIHDTLISGLLIEFRAIKSFILI